MTGRLAALRAELRCFCDAAFGIPSSQSVTKSPWLAAAIGERTNAEDFAHAVPVAGEPYVTGFQQTDYSRMLIDSMAAGRNVWLEKTQLAIE